MARKQDPFAEMLLAVYPVGTFVAMNGEAYRVMGAIDNCYILNQHFPKRKKYNIIVPAERIEGQFY